MKKTPKKILETSRMLFNKKGFSQVTIRMIALELGMSSGNLNYHFRKREDILEALYDEMVQVFDERIQKLPSQSFTINSIKSDILTSMNRMYDYRFFWTDLYNLLMLSEKIRAHFEQAYEERKAGYKVFLQALEQENLLKAFDWKKEQGFLIERMIGFSNTWLYSSALYQRKITKAYIDQQADTLLVMLYPYLTDVGKKEFRQLVPGYFE